jgi:hypothetical protein
MYKTVGRILSVLGISGMLVFAYQYFQAKNIFGLFGMDIEISNGNLLPIFFSFMVLLAGLLISKGGVSADIPKKIA